VHRTLNSKAITSNVSGLRLGARQRGAFSKLEL
jgi:hypothetical protein